ncbi:P-loop containing nucleoside triphosphate hydrolase protein [Penicillium cinerascens]|uniref:P-loop containing nucleoside triphosphate hydrolase protein n=1 Tax=Penicillium cinerascens TaxID=70096 RepID=A0A9W9T074_9EURO|nr:P-loop containing nucleoside triphosphate hydrolase protein [Penicillium cinerascens]KAJ5204618.1 P-loop containing nucleoside triphosphate hydrolase protein [Penicillium cinerascens]
MKHWAKDIVSSADGAEEFAYLVNQCFIHYGTVIWTGICQHIQEPDGLQTNESKGPSYLRKNDFVTIKLQPQQSSQAQEPTQIPLSTPSPSTESPRTSVPNAPDDEITKSIYKASKHRQREKQLDEHEKHLRETIQGMRVELEEQDSVLEFASIVGLEQRSTTGILLFGPQGTGKTLVIRSFARRYGLALYDVRASAIMSKFVGESEKFIRALFSEVREHAPAIILLDECDGLLCDPAADAMQSHHYRLLQNELKNQWSDLMQSRDEVIVVGATNKPHDIDMDGFGRRLSLKLHVDLPSAEGCGAILQEALSCLRYRLEESDFPVLGFLCHEKGLSGYDIGVLVEGLLRRAIRNITVSQNFRWIPWDDGHIIIPCAEGEPGATPVQWNKLSIDEPEAISYRPFVFSEVENAISRGKPTVDTAMRRKHAEFASQYATN